MNGLFVREREHLCILTNIHLVATELLSLVFEHVSRLLCMTAIAEWLSENTSLVDVFSCAPVYFDAQKVKMNISIIQKWSRINIFAQSVCRMNSKSSVIKLI